MRAFWRPRALQASVPPRRDRRGGRPFRGRLPARGRGARGARAEERDGLVCAVETRRAARGVVVRGRLVDRLARGVVARGARRSDCFVERGAGRDDRGRAGDARRLGYRVARVGDRVARVGDRVA
jgi:hypothetical protein